MSKRDSALQALRLERNRDKPHEKRIRNDKMNQRLRTAILGCGSFAHRHAHTLELLSDDFEMVAFCNRTLEKAVAFSEKYTHGRPLSFQISMRCSTRCLWMW